MAPKRERVSRSGESARRVTRSTSVQEEVEREDAEEGQEVAGIAEVAAEEAHTEPQTTRERRDDRRAEMNGSDESGTRRSKRLRTGGASGGDGSSSQQPADVVKRERAAGPVKSEADVAVRRQAGMVKREAAILAKRENVSRAKGKEKVVESNNGYHAEAVGYEPDGYVRDSQAAGPSTQPRARERAEPEEDAERPVTPSGMGEDRDGPEGTPTQATVALPRAMPRGEDGFQPGNILLVQVKHFMTYASISARPSPRLNLIVGPNGSGKSSLVCAIGLGLGGEPKMLGRAAHVGEFVQRGERSAEISIVLRGDVAGEEVYITRKISIENRTDWLLNGHGVRRDQVQECMKRFNIQISNLTQARAVGNIVKRFKCCGAHSEALQDRVCAFAGMSPIQLLEETQRAVGDPQLSQQHAFLKDQQDALATLHAVSDMGLEWGLLEWTLVSHEEQLGKLQVANAQVEVDVEKVQRREAILKEVSGAVGGSLVLYRSLVATAGRNLCKVGRNKNQTLFPTSTLLLPPSPPPTLSPSAPCMQVALMKKKVALMKKKVPWLKYERVKRRVREMEVAVEAMHKERDDLQTQVMAARDPLVALKESRGGFASLVAKIGRENEARERKLRELAEESDQLVQQAVERQRDVVQQAVERQRDVLEAKKKAESREQRLAKALADLQQLEAQLAALPEVKPPKAAVVRDGKKAAWGVGHEIMGEAMSGCVRVLERARDDLQQLDARSWPHCRKRAEQLDMDPLAKRGRELRMQAGEKEREGRQLEQQMSVLREQMGRVERRINEVANSRNRRIERAGDRELKQACEWLDHNRTQCKGAVYGPILAEVNVIDPDAHAVFLEGPSHSPCYAPMPSLPLFVPFPPSTSLHPQVNVIDPDAHAACLEQHVPVWVWKAFVTTVPEDRDFLVRHLKPLGLAVVNESSRPEELGPPAHAMAVDAHLQRLGVTHRLDEVFNAAPVVRSVLNQQSQLFRSFVGSAEADRNAEAIQERGVEDLWTPESHYRWLRSRYNGSLSINAHGVRPSRFFSQESGLQEEEQLQAERERIDARGMALQERANAVRREQRTLEAEAAQCERQRDEIVNEYHGQKKQRTDLQNRIGESLSPLSRHKKGEP
ncbi:unnamed protein product [Closterium sp. NIES-65]|nr:unnamed protein product [Closterium sp. NIES-65]